MTFHVELPMPPSANALFFNRAGKGRVKTTTYRDWRKNAVLAIYAQVRADRRVAGAVSVHIALPFKCRLDVDNTIKPILDALVGSNRIDDDANVREVTASKQHDLKIAVVTVSERPWPKAVAA